MSNINLREELLKLDKQALDNDTKYYDLCTLYEASNLSNEGKKKLVENIKRKNSKAIFNLLNEAYEDDLVDFDDHEVTTGGKFIEDGREWTWIRQVSDVAHLDFDSWAVWMAFAPKDENNPNGPNDVAFFIVDVDNGFIDWGPLESADEAHEFLQSKIDDYEMDESISDDIRKNNLKYDDYVDGWYTTDGNTEVQFQDRQRIEHPDVTKYRHVGPKVKSNTWGRVWKDGKLDKQFEGPKYKVRQDVARYLDKNEDLNNSQNELNKNIERNADIDNELDQLYSAVCRTFGEKLAEKLIVECGGATYDENPETWWTPELDENKLYSKFIMLFINNMLNYEDFDDASDMDVGVYDIIAKVLNLPTTSDLDDPGYDYDPQKIWDKVRNKLNSTEIKEELNEGTNREVVLTIHNVDYDWLEDIEIIANSFNLYINSGIRFNDHGVRDITVVSLFELPPEEQYNKLQQLVNYYELEPDEYSFNVDESLNEDKTLTLDSPVKPWYTEMRPDDYQLGNIDDNVTFRQVMDAYDNDTGDFTTEYTIMSQDAINNDGWVDSDVVEFIVKQAHKLNKENTK